MNDNSPSSWLILHGQPKGDGRTLILSQPRTACAVQDTTGIFGERIQNVYPPQKGAWIGQSVTGRQWVTRRPNRPAALIVSADQRFAVGSPKSTLTSLQTVGWYTVHLHITNYDGQLMTLMWRILHKTSSSRVQQQDKPHWPMPSI